MAIVENFWLKDQRKRLANAVIYQAMGQTRSRKLAETITNPRTEAQMTQRVKWSNLVNLYRVNKSWMKYAFETKKVTQSEYNKFMSLNVTGSPIYLTKALAAGGGCVVAPYQITQGSLPSIEVTPVSTEFYTNIVFPDNFDLVATTTVGELSTSLLANNPAIHEGDQLSFIKMTQQVNADNGIPYVVVRKYELLVNSTSSQLVKDFLPLNYIGIIQDGNLNRLYVKNSGLAGGFVLILSRTISGKTFVSSQKIIPVNNAALIAAYSSASALQAAIESYGENAEAFLASTYAAQGPTAPVLLSILSVQVGTDLYIPGYRYDNLPAWNNKTIKINLSGSVSVSGADFEIRYWLGGERFTVSESLDDAQNVMTLQANTGSEFDVTEGAVLESIKVDTGSGVFEASFVVRNEDTIGGLE